MSPEPIFGRTVLANGVRILCHSAPGVYGARLRLTYLAGASLETDEIAGLAHLTEHMMFKGTATHDAQALARAIERQGGEVDAYTDHYETTYVAVAPGASLGPVLAVVADMLRNPRLADSDIERERAVVLEELATYQDEPATLAYQGALASLWHGAPQGRSVAGTATTVSRLDGDDLRHWLASQYGANRLVIAAAGAVEPAALVEQVAAHFGDLPAVRPLSLTAPQPNTAGPLVTLRRRPGEQVALSLAMPAPTETDPDIATADLLAMLLGGNDCSRLFTRLRDELGLVYGIDATLESGPIGGQLVITTECAPASLERVLAEITATIDRFIAEPPALDEVNDAATALHARWLLPFDSPLSYADWLVGREAWHGGIIHPRVAADRFALVTPADVQSMARRCLAPATRHLGLVGPLPVGWRPMGWTPTPAPAPRRRRAATAGRPR